MNSENNISPETVQKAETGLVEKKPGLAVIFIFALLAAVSAALMPEFGYISAIALTATLVFLVSAKTPIPVFIIPFIGIVASAMRGGFVMLGITSVFAVAAIIAGWVIQKGGDFHRALMMFTLVTLAAAVVAVAVYTKIYDISVTDISEVYSAYLNDILSVAVTSAGSKLTLENAELITEQYEAVMQTALLYSPAMLGWIIEICGIVALRLAGLFHDRTGSTLYPKHRRPAVLSRTFAVIYLVSLFVGAVSSDVVGCSAGNIMMILMIPASAAGVSSYREMIGQRKNSGKAGIPPSLMMLIAVFLFMSPAVGIIVLALTGSLSAFKGKISR